MLNSDADAVERRHDRHSLQVARELAVSRDAQLVDRRAIDRGEEAEHPLPVAVAALQQIASEHDRQPESCNRLDRDRRGCLCPGDQRILQLRRGLSNPS